MSIEVTRADERDLERWDQYVERSAQGNLFHQRAALDIQATYSSATVHHLIGKKGQEVVGIFPVFTLRKGPVTTVFSPPPEIRIPYLGPAMVTTNELKQRKAERRGRRFVDGCLDWLDDHVNPRYLHVRTDDRYDDVRPFMWRGCSVTPQYTYRVDLTPGVDDVQMRFSSDARRNVRTNGDGTEFDIVEGNVDDARRINEQVRHRYESQDVGYFVPDALVTELYERLPDGQVRPYVCRVDGEFVGGLLALEYGDTVYRWQGGVKIDADVNLPVNDLLDWQVMSDAIERGLSSYDLVGADNPRINRYKAKFGPELSVAHEIERGSLGVDKMAHLYKRLRG